MAWKRELVVGAFVSLGIALTAAVIFTIGQERRVFAKRVEFIANFPDVQGLKPGAPVRLSGVDIGTVKSINHGPNPQDDRLYVHLDIVQDEAVRVREDSIAKVANKGMLGDKMLEVTPGTPGRAPLKPGASITSEEPADYGQLLTRLGEVAKKTEAVVTNLERTTATFADERTRRDMQESLRSMTVILGALAEGKGYAGKLLADPAEAERIRGTFNRMDDTMSKLNHTLDGVGKVVDRVNKGPGLAHSIIYDDDGVGMMKSFAHAADEVSLSLRGVREGNGLAKVMIYGGPGQEKIGEDVLAITKDARDIVANVKKGKGTIGGLLVDPSVYEDMKMLLGNVQRNDVLRALVRYSIKEDEKKPKVEVAPSTAASAK